MPALVSPIPGAPFSSDGFGARAPIVTPGGTTGAFHYGQDIDVPAGTPILASAAGTVIASGWIGTYGYAVYIDHGGGVVTRYAHMLAPPPVGSGWHVEQGDRIGFVGSTGASTGAHLHWEVVVHGVRVDPLSYLANQSTTPDGQEEEDEMQAGMYRKEGKVYHVIIGNPDSGFKLKYTATSADYNTKKATQFKTGDFTEEDASVMRAFEEALDAVRQGK